jgi:hypothetical protein
MGVFHSCESRTHHECVQSLLQKRAWIANKNDTENIPGFMGQSLPVALHAAACTSRPWLLTHDPSPFNANQSTNLITCCGRCSTWHQLPY